MSALIPNLKVVDKIKNPDEIVLTKGLLKDKLFIWGNNMVKAAKDISSSNWVSPILLGLLLTYGVYSNQQNNARLDEFKKESDKQHDLLIRIETLNEVAEKEKVQEKVEKKLDKDMEDVYRKDMKDKMIRLELIVQGRFPTNNHE